jgi:hypothetical protein
VRVADSAERVEIVARPIRGLTISDQHN